MDELQVAEQLEILAAKLKSGQLSICYPEIKDGKLNCFIEGGKSFQLVSIEIQNKDD